jgi:hypothetical protein
MTSLYFRAAKRCEQNILRVWPAWRQAHITDADRGEFEDWKAANVAHLRDLQDQIVKGGEPDIDRGWPTGTVPEQPEPEPAPDAEAAKEALMRGLDKLEEKHAEMQAKAQEIERQEGDMFDTSQLQDLIRENEPHAEAQRRWQSDYNQLLNRLVDSRLPPLSPTEREYQRRLQAALYMGRMGAVEIL